MEINKVQWRMIAKGERLPCDSFLMKYDGTIPPLISGAGVVIGQNAYYLPVEELRSLPKEESKDERIRKWLIHYFKEVCDNVSEKEKKCILSWLEKQGEQKPTDKIEPKFKAGDWIIKNDDSSINIDYSCCEIKKVENGNYTIESIYGYKGYNTFETFEKDYHLWSIQDAKAGDVLVSNDASYIVLFKGLSDLEDGIDRFKSYCHYYRKGIFSPIEDPSWCCNNFHPATKEQRDTLMKAIADEGYTFDFKKKELKKIEPFDKYEGLTDFERTLIDICIGWIGEEPGWKQYIKDNADVLLKIAIKKFNSVQDVPFEQKPTPIFRIGDTIIAKDGTYIEKEPFHIDMIEDDCYWDGENTILVCNQDKFEIFKQKSAEWSEDDQSNFNELGSFILETYRAEDASRLLVWFKSLKERVQPQPKQEWSEEDEKILSVIIKDLVRPWNEYIPDRIEYEIKWLKNRLKSLKDKYTWKPRDEQMDNK